MRSVVVVLPASMCAMIPMLRVLASGNCRMRVGSAMVFPSARERPSWGVQANRGRLRRRGEAPLPTIVGERLVRFGHLVHVVLALDRCAHAVGGVEQFVGEALRHGLFPPLP